jgi:drug/metabolite transporter (DMT)-like permease
MKLAPDVAALVLLSALLHATWNAILKSDEDHLLSFALVAGVGSLIGFAALPWVAAPARAAWPYLALSVAVHNTYYVLLLRSYAHGDLSHVYPIARGLAPLVVAGLSSALAGERLSDVEAAGVALVSAGIAGLALGGGVPRARERLTLAYALATGLAIATYTVTDGLGARRSGDPLGYIMWLNALEGPAIVLVAVARRGRTVLPYLRRRWWRGAGGGLIATLGYALAIWALSVAGMAHVAALRESSALFAAIIGATVLREPFGARRIAAAALVVAGLVAMNLR